MLKYYYYSTYKFNEHTYPHFTIQFSDKTILRHASVEPIFNMWTLKFLKKLKDLILPYFVHLYFM